MTCGTASSYSLPSCPKDSNHLSRWGGLSASKQSCHSDALYETNEVICTLFSETMNQIGCQRRSTMDRAGLFPLLMKEKTVLALLQILIKFCRHRIKTFTTMMRRRPLASLT